MPSDGKQGQFGLRGEAGRLAVLGGSLGAFGPSI